MAKWYLSLSETKKNLFVLLGLTLAVFLCLIPLFFFDGGKYPLGWLLGSAIGMAAYLSIAYGSSAILEQDTKAKGTVLAVLMLGARFILYAGGLVVAAICTFKPQWFGGWNAFNFWTVFAGYLPLCFIIPIRQLIANKKEGPAAPQDPMANQPKDDGEQR